MTFKQITNFLTVAEHLNFTRAAAALFITQSTLSRSIASLEEELGVTLIQRDFHHAKLTPAGEYLYREMKEAMETMNAIVHTVQSMGDLEKTRFVIGVLDGQTVQSDILLAIRSLCDRLPHLNVDIRRGSHRALMDDLRRNTVDVVQTIMAGDSALAPEFTVYPLRVLQTFLIAQSDDPIWQGSVICPTTLDGRTLIVPEEASPGLSSVIRRLQEAGIRPVIKTAQDMETQSLWLEAGMGVYLGTEGSVIYNSRSFRPIAAAPLAGISELTEVLIWKTDPSSTLLSLFVSFLNSESESNSF